MRKYFIGALAGFLLTIPFTTGAESTSFVGKKITKEYDVIVDGKKIPVKAISINGTSFTPNRALADSIGYDVAFTGDAVILSDPFLEGATPESPSPTPIVQGGDPVEPSTQEQINDLEKQLFAANDEWIQIIGMGGGKPLSEEKQKRVDELNALMQELQTQLDALKAQATPTP